MIDIPVSKCISTLLLGMLLSAAASATAAEAPAAGSPAATSGEAALKVYRDPVTGKLRQPEHDEASGPDAATRRPQASARTIPDRVVEPKVQKTRSGGTSMTLGEEHLNYSIAVRKPDGSVKVHCVEGKQAADALLKQDATTASTPKEQANDR
ncbi:hypothetical protein FNU76_05835 [Chitinimonas arctica]|uniref:PepSY domain-containing protein n=1 Tax=Chitinimonas arctica TaxID=2594795 RepID=A0A516SCN8_9NEIS|nr:hypothetical protein [Chitinimonas arctica]QDQ25910.1 hypothetical protein FNU76_05835 [Chitinimonas arctica]